MRLAAEGISKRYIRPAGEANTFEAVRKTDLTLEGGSVTVLMGRSGSGKTTLLHMLAGLLAPTEGRVLLEGTEKDDRGNRDTRLDLYAMDDRTLSRFRNEKIGVIPQGRSAVETLSVRENILLPGTLYHAASGDDGERADYWMERLGIASLARVSPRELSGGELRRMAIARALCARPAVLLADEPTGDLDDANTELVLRVLRETADQGTAVLLVTHENAAEAVGDTVLRMDAGSIRRD